MYYWLLLSCYILISYNIYVRIQLFHLTETFLFLGKNSSFHGYYNQCWFTILVIIKRNGKHIILIILLVRLILVKFSLLGQVVRHSTRIIYFQWWSDRRFNPDSGQNFFFLPLSSLQRTLQYQTCTYEWYNIFLPNSYYFYNIYLFATLRRWRWRWCPWSILRLWSDI